MFEQTFIPRAKTHRPWTVVLAFFGELALVGIGVLIPMMWVQALPKEQLMSYLVAPLPPPPPPPPPPDHMPKAEKVVPSRVVEGRLFAPHFIPKTIIIPKTQEEVAPPTAGAVVGGVLGGVPGGQLGGVIGGIIGSVGNAPLPPPPPPKSVPPAPVPQRILVGGNVQAALLIHKVTPEYPPIARDARIEGVVRLAAVIDTSGRIQSLRVVSGHPLLVRAAMQAVRQWVYKPTRLNGVPVEVATEIDVRFALG